MGDPGPLALIVHGAGTGVFCETIKGLLAIVIVPRRGLGPALAPTVYATAPLPLPGLPLFTVIHGALLVAVHAQPVGMITPTGDTPPLAITT